MQEQNSNRNITIHDNSGFLRVIAKFIGIIMLILTLVLLFLNRDNMSGPATIFHTLLVATLIVALIAVILSLPAVTIWQVVSKWLEIRRLSDDHKRVMVEIDLAKAALELLEISTMRHDSVKAISYAGTVESINPESTIQQNRLTVQQQRELTELRSQKLLMQSHAMPEAPVFKDMKYLIGGSDELVLGYGNDGPIYGTVKDLLSMMFVGKPGRGKSSALLYYTAILVMINAIVWVFDPQGSMSEIKGVLNYKDTMEDIEDSLPDIYSEITERENLWRQNRSVKPPMLILIDEIPLIADYEADKKIGNGILKLTRKAVLEWRKYNVYVILSGQSLPATVLPTLTRDNLASRLVFYSSDAHARMAGLDEDSRKKLLPVLRKAKAGTAILDVSTRDEPDIASIPFTTVNDLVEIVDGEIVEDSNSVNGMGSETVNFRNEMTGGNQTEIISFIEDTTTSTEKLPNVKSEISRFSTRNDKKKEIQRLRGLGLKQGEIIFKIWGASPGASAAYREALAEYKSLLEELIMEV